MVLSLNNENKFKCYKCQSYFDDIIKLREHKNYHKNSIIHNFKYKPNDGDISLF